MGAEESMFRVDRTDAETILRLHGELDVTVAPALRHTLLGLIRTDDDRRVVVDLADVSFIDVPSLGVLAGAAARLRQTGGQLTVRAPNPFTRRVVLLAGLVTLLEDEPPEPPG